MIPYFIFTVYFLNKIIRHDINNMVDIADLTWEQKERVLRELFARMNLNKKETQKADQIQAITNGDDAKFNQIEEYSKSVLIQNNNNNNNQG